MASFQVTCHAPDELDAERRIRGLGGQGWWFPTEAIIQMLEQQQFEFWVSTDNQRVDLAVRRHGVAGRKFLTTVAGEFPPNTLLRLPICTLGEGTRGTSDRIRWAPVP